MRDFEREAEITRGLLSLPEVGVQQRHYDQAQSPAVRGLMDTEKPQHWTEAARERDGSAKFFGKMLLGGMTGMTPFLFPEMFGGKARYAAEMETYTSAQEKLRELQALADIDPSNPTIGDISMGTDANKELGDFMAGNYIGNTNSSTWVAEQARKAGMTYSEFMDMDEKARNAIIYNNADEEERAQLDWIAGRQTRDQKAGDAGAVTRAQEEARQGVLEDTTARQQSPQMQVAFDTINDVLNKGDYHSIYGTVDSETPTWLQSSQNAQTQIEKISAILYMFARGELKGQGQVTEDEAKWAMKSRSSLMDFAQGDEAARAEMMLIQRQLGEKLGIADESMYYSPTLSTEDLVDQYSD